MTTLNFKAQFSVSCWTSDNKVINPHSRLYQHIPRSLDFSHGCSKEEGIWVGDLAQWHSGLVWNGKTFHFHFHFHLPYQHLTRLCWRAMLDLWYACSPLVRSSLANVVILLKILPCIVRQNHEIVEIPSTTSQNGWLHHNALPTKCRVILVTIADFGHCNVQL